MGEIILDEVLKMMKLSEKYGVGVWVDFMSGEYVIYIYELSIRNLFIFGRWNMECYENWLLI